MNTVRDANPKIVILGHVCIDDNNIEGDAYRSWGSPAMYMASYYEHIYGLKTHIISEYGNDFEEYIQDFVVMITKPTRKRTLVYKNIVSEGRRTQFCENIENSPPVALGASVAELISRADIFIVAPEIPNYSDEYIQAAVNLTKKDCKKILLPQGLLRKLEGTHVKKGSLNSPSIIRLFDAVILSDQDITDAVKFAKSWSKTYVNASIVITRAEQGAALIQDGRKTEIPTKPIALHKITNPIGAGDMFSAEMTMRLFEGASFEHAIQTAHHTTAKILTSRNKLSL